MPRTRTMLPEEAARPDIRVYIHKKAPWDLHTQSYLKISNRCNNLFRRPAGLSCRHLQILENSIITRLTDGFNQEGSLRLRAGTSGVRVGA